MNFERITTPLVFYFVMQSISYIRQSCRCKKGVNSKRLNHKRMFQ